MKGLVISRDFNWLKKGIKSYLNPVKLKHFLYALIRTILIMGIAFLIIYPFFYKFTRVIMSEKDMLDKTVNYIAKSPSLFFIKETIIRIDYWEGLKNLSLQTISSSLLQLIVCTLTGYGFARFHFKGRNIIFALVILTLLVPPQVILIPLFMKFRFFDILGLVTAISGRQINLIDTSFPFWILSLTGLGLKNGLYIYIMRQFFRSMPGELEEAAYVDGCGVFKTFFSIMLPNARTMMLTVFLLSFCWQWTDTFYSGLFMNNKNILLNYITKAIAYENSPVIISAFLNSGLLLTITPLIIIYIFAQNLFLQGVERSGIVG